MTDSIAAQVAALPKTPTPQLKKMWRELYDKEPPGFSRNYLISRLAYRIQELAHGGLKPATRAKLDALADGLDPKAARKRVVNGPVVGTQLIREWRGIEQKVTVLADGFEWEGRRYKSLSAVARAITGSCAVTSVPAADVEGAVLEHVQKLLAAPELVARAWAAAKGNDEHEITEREVTVLLADFATVWRELFPAEQARIVQLLVERVDMQEKALEVRIRAEGLASLVGDLRQDERRAA